MKKKKAIIHTQGRQFIVSPGDILFVNQFPETNAGDDVTISEVLAIVDDQGSIKTGTPLVSGASVTVKILENKRGEKIRIYKKKRRKGYQRRKGHRQELSVIKVQSINS